MRRIVFTMAGLALLLFSSCKPAMSPAGHAIILGIARYDPLVAEGSKPNLTYTVDDANSMAALLTEQGWTVDLLLDSAATKENLVARLADVKGSTLPVLVYYSGHGLNDNADFYMVTYGSVIHGSPYTFDYDLMVKPQELNAMFRDNAIEHGIAILDSCFSGGFVPSGNGVSLIPADYTKAFELSEFSSFTVQTAIQGYMHYAQSANAVFIAAAGAGEESWENSSYGHGIFTYYLLEASRLGDLDGDGYVSSIEAFTYTARNIEMHWNSSAIGDEYVPRYSGKPRDYLLFKVRP